MTNTDRVLVCVVNDDESVQESLPALLREFCFASEVFAAPHDFLQSGFLDEASCMILDVAMPVMSGPELHRKLLRQGHDIPTILMTAHADLAAQPNMRAGVVDCLLKPFDDTTLLEALKKAVGLL